MNMRVACHEEHKARRVRLGMPVCGSARVSLPSSARDLGMQADSHVARAKDCSLRQAWRSSLQHDAHVFNWFACVGRTGGSVTVESIVLATSRHFGVSIRDLRSAKRVATVVRPRQVAMYLCRRMTSRSLPDIGRRMGGRDHTTVLHAVRKIAWLMEQDLGLAADVRAIVGMVAS